MAEGPQLLAIGFPEAGKTTFLAALWHVVESEEIEQSLCLERLSGDAQYLNSIKNDWLRCQKVKPTIPGKEEFPSLWLRDRVKGAVGQVDFPDLAGEFFTRAWVNRRWSVQYDSIVTNANSLLLFISPFKVNDPYTISDVELIGEAALHEEISVDSSQSAPPRMEAPAAIVEKWEPEKAATQVQLVELLQFVAMRIRAKPPIKVAVVISAWDLIATKKSSNMSPSRWLERHLSYLDQFLKSNFERFEVRIFGVSAQGGDLPAEYEQLVKFEHASERIRIVGTDCAKHDISEPVRWGLGFSDAIGKS
jgi:hypothetical protein